MGRTHAPTPPRDGDLDLQLTRLALDADHPAITADCTATAVHALRQGPASDAAELGHHAIALLDRHHHPVPLTLLRAVADAAVTSGDGDRADALLHRAVQQVRTNQQLTGPADRAAVLYDHANRLITRGETGQAETLLHQAQRLFTDLGDTREAAITWGRIANVLERRGEVEEALRIRREVQLPVFERIGDTREAAITWGRIANILEQRGEVEEALRIRREVQLPVFERIGDTREAAITWGQIANVLEQRGEVEEALRIRREVQLPVFERIGDTREAAITWGQIANILEQRGEVEEAVEMQLKRLEVNEQLSDIDGIAAASWDLARIDLSRQDRQAAEPRLVRSFQLFVNLQRADGIAVVGIRLGQVLLARGVHAQARQVLRTCRAAASVIGAAGIVAQADELMETIDDEDEES
ncbi:tetratricopeptide repeat protein [Streptomyces sp. SHP 1-2]|uniref:tetratricopeptide repeat protein n=1 Tax=Streptomyces sp. SHP 1-2 TaxID=2769489 RepID=UPI00223830E9|nr:tetratricopeptide repeat protein [Streptomyces sp. SHP 1-2]